MSLPHVRRRSLLLERRRSTRACCARAPCRAGCGQLDSYTRTLPRQEASLVRLAAVARPASPASNTKPAAARERSLFLGRRRSTRACCARSPRRAGCGWLMLYTRAPHQREASLLRTAALVRRASYRLQRQAGCRAGAKRTHAGARCFSGEGAALKLAVRARRAALVVVASYARQGHCTGERRFSQWPTTMVWRPSYGLQRRACRRVLAKCTRAGGRCLSGERSALELAAPARHAALVVVGIDLLQGHCASEKPLSFGARQWHGMPATASVNQAYVLRPLLFLGIRRSTRACCAHAPCRACCSRLWPFMRALNQQEASLLRPAAVVRRSSYRLQRQAGCCA